MADRSRSRDLENPLALDYNKRMRAESGEKVSKGSRSLSGRGDLQLRLMFNEWAKKHNRTYINEEEQEKRFKIWCCYKEEVDPYMAGDNIDRMYWFADLTHSEKRAMNPYMSPSKRSSSPTPHSRSPSKRSSSPTPPSRSGLFDP